MKQAIQSLSQRLAAEFGKGLDRSNLWHMRGSYLAYPKVDALRRELSWTYRRMYQLITNGGLLTGQRRFAALACRK